MGNSKTACGFVLNPPHVLVWTSSCSRRDTRNQAVHQNSIMTHKFFIVSSPPPTAGTDSGRLRVHAAAPTSGG